MKTPPNLLREARSAAGLTQEQVSARVEALKGDCDQASLSRYEKGKGRPKPETCGLLADVLSVSRLDMATFFYPEMLEQRRIRNARKNSRTRKRAA